ncbi:adenine-N(1)--methyltransferase non-catalytic subunit trm6 [Emericellopsis atlantica]|uniref:tRNA (adenine(58)-N(1))-methyltransferase non-catalytic subunit TRM6 n=1 Tax=Emericellopsis atlantica TaxID=2614577 RepID=A0A9P7ZRC3_9HYPO|nr:adenine-N(1)--methyltransferase non-catalytic subunit trm6 [Emericellopsis atlantica]KAG9256265.1 adenine-N(1)--methyltransferase non-catalytic subunit trm6 [Emericellopsis atlantica]
MTTLLYIASMSRDLVQPNAWVAIKLPNDMLRVLQVVPNTTISLGKYGSFPSNLIIERPYNLTYEVQDQEEGETYSRLRIVPGVELNADALADTSADKDAIETSEETAETNDDDDVIVPADGEDFTLVDDSGKVIARSSREVLDDSARQTLTSAEIEELKKKGTSAGQDLIAKLLLSHTAIDQKTQFSLAKYKLLKTKKYIRRFTVLPLDVPLLAHWMLEDKDASKILEMRQESMALLGCWADTHFASQPEEGAEGPHAGQWLVVDDTGGLLTASLAERMGILHQTPEEQEQPETSVADAGSSGQPDGQPTQKPKRRRLNDLEVPYAPNNTLTVLHHNTQPNLFMLRYFDFDNTEINPTPPYHPLYSNLLSLSWLQLVSPELDQTYSDPPAEVDPETVASWKTNQRGNYHRKRRRWARTKHIIDTTRAGGFAGLAVASTMEPISILRHTLPLLAGGAPVAIYSQTVEPLAALADAFSITRRAAWVSSPPAETEGKTVAEIERWEGNDEFPINPTLLLGASIQTSRARRWQVLPQRTHPLMTERGGAEGYIFTAWRAIPVEGKIEARGRFRKRKAGA